MAGPKSLTLVLVVAAVLATVGAGWLLLAGDPGIAPEGGSGGGTGGTGAVEAGSAAGGSGQGPTGGADDDEEEDDLSDLGLDRDPEGPVGGATTEEILAAAAAGDWREVERLLSINGSADPLVTELLLRTLEDGRYRNKAASLARYLEDPAALARFLEVARGEGDERTRACAIAACASIGGAGVYEAAAELLRSAPPGSTLATSAAGALGTLGTVDAARALVDMLRKPESERYAAVYVEALSRVSTPEALEDLGRLARDEGMDARLREGVIAALGRSGRAEAVPDILAALRDTESPAIRSAAFEALGRIGDPAGVQELLNRFHGGDDGARLEAARALEAVRNGASVQMLEEALGHPVADVLRASLVQALGNIGSPSSVRALARVGENAAETEGLRGTAAMALGRTGSRDAVDPLVRMFEASKEEERTLRHRIAGSLLATAEKDDLPRIEALLKRARPRTPEHATLESLVRNLGRPRPEGVPLLKGQ